MQILIKNRKREIFAVVHSEGTAAPPIPRIGETVHVYYNNRRKKAFAARVLDVEYAYLGGYLGGKDRPHVTQEISIIVDHSGDEVEEGVL